MRTRSSRSWRRTRPLTCSATRGGGEPTWSTWRFKLDTRSRGIGSRLLEAVEQWARENSAELITLGTNLRSDFGAVAFYERHGYERQAVILRKTLA